MRKRKMAGASAKLCFALFASAALGTLGAISAHAQPTAEPVYGRVESFDARAQRIVVDGRSYALPNAARIEWQGGRAVDRAAVEPRMRVSLSLVSSTADDDIPQVRTLTLHMD